jgi:glycosyltransferase involved in cell wall biosynthesis
VLVGDGPERSSLEAEATQLGLDGRVVFAGWQDEPEAYLGSFDVFVLSSRVEGFPLSVLEAMGAGLPVVATTVGSVDELVLDGETGFSASRGRGRAPRAIAVLWRRPLCRRMGDADASRQNAFSPETMIAKFETSRRASADAGSRTLSPTSRSRTPTTSGAAAMINRC